jgi:hypothetical protein
MEFERFDEATFTYLGTTYAITIWIDPYAEMYLADWLQTDPPGPQPATRTKTPRPFPHEVISEAILQAARHAERLAADESADPTAGMDVVGKLVNASFGADNPRKPTARLGHRGAVPHAPAPRRRTRT